MEKVSPGKLKVAPCLFYVVKHHLLPKTMACDQVNHCNHCHHGEVAIESNVVEEGFVGRLLNDKLYNRSEKFHKLFYEACMPLVWKELIHGFQKTTNKTQF